MKLAEYDPNYIYADNDDENQKMEADEVGVVTLTMTTKMPNKMMMIRVGKLEEVLIV